MMRIRNPRRGGSTLIEFTLVGIPVIFVLLSTIEMARGMWLYHTLAYAARQGTRYSIVHGINCSIFGNTYCVNIPNVAGAIQSAAPGLDATQMTVTLTPSQGTATTDTLANLLNSSTYSARQWPPSSPTGTNAVGRLVQISVVYPFNSGICMFWPGSRPTSAAGLIYLPATSTDRIQF
jgi:Flp pilus assembly protein TadG